MTTAQPVAVTRTVDRESRQTDLDRVRTLARLLDTQFEVAGYRFGLDGIIGLVPGVGDTLTALIGLYPLHVARKHGVGRLTLARMAGNLATDWLIGAIPLVGDVFDFAYKANTRNLKLLIDALEKVNREETKARR
jgi:hypothetical protein